MSGPNSRSENVGLIICTILVVQKLTQRIQIGEEQSFHFVQPANNSERLVSTVFNFEGCNTLWIYS